MKSKLSLPTAVAGLLICILAVTLWKLTLTDSLTTDEKAHIPAGITYVTERSLALNPEHPPLMKLLTGISILTFANPDLPSLKETTDRGTNLQYEHGDLLLARNTAQHDALVRYGRLPFILMTLLFAFLIFRYLRNRFDDVTGLLGLALFAFSPTIISHGHLVTFDVAAAFGFFVAILSFAAFLKSPTVAKAIWAGVGLAVALLIKFSALVLLPVFAVAFIGWLLVKRPSNVSQFFGRGSFVIITAGVLVYLSYFILTIGYPPAVNKRDVLELTKAHHPQSVMHFTADLTSNRLTQPIGVYMLGTLQTAARSLGGNSSYFMGTVENFGTRTYFPVLFLTKESLPAVVIVLWAAIHTFIMFLWKRKEIRWKQLIVDNPAESMMILAVVLYWLLALTSTLNIGYRHVMPTIPLIFILSAVALGSWFTSKSRQIQRIIVGLLAVWVIAEPLIHYPNLLNYYNQIVGGDAKGYEVSVDSNYDWGQDLGRLGLYIKEKNIDKIAVDYFGGDLSSYYLGDRYEVWRSSYGPPIGWFAISATVRQNAMEPHSADLPIGEIDTYWWLRNVEPVDRIGSIFIYHF